MVEFTSVGTLGCLKSVKLSAVVRSLMSKKLRIPAWIVVVSGLVLLWMTWLFDDPLAGLIFIIISYPLPVVVLWEEYRPKVRDERSG
jgi:hypothetical protein